MKPKCVIFDIDGTIADCSHRRHFLDKKDWDGFFDAMGDDTVIDPVRDLLEFILQDEYKPQLIFCTGRPDSHKIQTVDWLTEQSIYDDEYELHMRKTDDYRPDYVIKKEMLDTIRQDYDVLFTVDDRGSVVKMWRENGLTCFQAAPCFESEQKKYLPGTLHLLVGPSGAGKSTYAILEFDWEKIEVVSSDNLRQAFCGDWKDQSKNEQVFDALKAIVKARIDNGLETVVDATNIRNADRRSLRDLVGPDCRIVYHVIDRPIKEKLATGGWRLEVFPKGGNLNLVESHHNTMHNNLKDILRGDNDPRVEVKDMRT